jgi:hypothetical protein
MFGFAKVFASESSDSLMIREVISTINSLVENEKNSAIQMEYSIIPDLTPSANADSYVSQNGKSGYKIILSKGFLDEIVKGDKSRLAFVIAHEYAHLFFENNNKKAKTDFLYNQISRENEFAADTMAMKLILQAGYSYKAALEVFKIWRSFNNFSSIESTGELHPSWTERLTKIYPEKNNLLRSMDAFEKGVYFLSIDSYIYAENYFQKVTEEFPDCFEAFSNLGYSYLMDYISKLSKDDIRNFGIVSFVAGAFYRSPESLHAQIRAKDSDKWLDAYFNLRKASELNNQSAITYSNLGLLSLLHSSGKPDYTNARRYFSIAVELAEKDSLLDNLSRVSIYINAGLSLPVDSLNQQEENIIQAEKYLFAFASSNNTTGNNYKNILTLNQAYLFSRQSKNFKKSIDLFEQYLKNESQSSPIWIIAKDYYLDLCKKNNINPVDLSKTKKTSDFIKVSSVTIDSIYSIEIGKDISEMKDSLKKYNFVESSIIEGTTLVKWKSQSAGIEIIASEIIRSIFLFSSKAPKLLLEKKYQKTGTNSIQIGMSRKDLNKILAKDENFIPTFCFTSPNNNFIYYPELGLAFKFKSGLLDRIAITY